MSNLDSKIKRGGRSRHKLDPSIYLPTSKTPEKPPTQKGEPEVEFTDSTTTSGHQVGPAHLEDLDTSPIKVLESINVGVLIIGKSAIGESYIQTTKKEVIQPPVKTEEDPKYSLETSPNSLLNYSEGDDVRDYISPVQDDLKHLAKKAVQKKKESKDLTDKEICEWADKLARDVANADD